MLRLEMPAQKSLWEATSHQVKMLSGMPCLKRNSVRHNSPWPPSPIPGEIARKLAQADFVGFSDQADAGIEQARRILRRHPLEGQQEDNASRKDIDSQQRTF